MQYKLARLAVYLLIVVVCGAIALTVGNQVGLMAAIAIGLFAEMCLVREVFLRRTRVSVPSGLTNRRLQDRSITR